jgi:hypothetical protein
MIWLLYGVLLIAAYVLSAGLAFVATYRWPALFNGLVLSRIYGPLEWLSNRNRYFGRQYSNFLFWCYRRLGPTKD